MGLSLGCLSVPEIPPALKLLLLCSLLASDGCVKSGGGVFGTVCLEAEAKWWWWWWCWGWGGRLMNRRTGLCCSALPTAGASHHALHALSQNSLWPHLWRQISHALANSNKFFYLFLGGGGLFTITIFLTDLSCT